MGENVNKFKRHGKSDFSLRQVETPVNKIMLSLLTPPLLHIYYVLLRFLSLDYC